MSAQLATQSYLGSLGNQFWYQLGEKIGVAGLASVYKAPRMGTAGQELRALQLPAPSSSAAGAKVSAVTSEVKLRHPQIINVRDVLFDKVARALSFVTDLAPTTLANVLASSTGGLPENTIRTFMQHILDALDYCHKNGIVKRDIRPDALYIYNWQTAAANLRLAAYSWVAEGGNAVQAASVYTAPELLKAPTSTATPAADIWSCGVILFQMLFPSQFAAVVASTAANPDAWAALAPTWMDKIPPTHPYPADCINFLRGMLNPNPAERATMTAILQNVWLLTGSPAKANIGKDNDGRIATQASMTVLPGLDKWLDAQLGMLAS